MYSVISRHVKVIPMREWKHRVCPGVILALSLLAGACTPASILADTVDSSTSAPDLTIETVTWSPQTSLIGDTVTFTVTVRNQGSDQAGASHVAYYIDGTPQGSAPINRIDSGATAVKTFTWTAMAGSHTFRATADSGNEVIESDENNNDNTFAFSVLAPDVVVESLTWSPENPSIRDEVTFTVTIKNQGTSTARYSSVDLFIDGSSRGRRDVPRLDAGANVTRTFTWVVQAGPHTVRAVADVLNQVTESDETNNDKTVTYSTATPDLIVTGITWSPTSPSVGANVTFTVTLKNQGSGKADNSWVDCYIDDSCQSSLFVSQLATGATTTKTFNWTATAGPHTIMAVIDANSEVIESDETNNTFTAAMGSLAPDLLITGITWSPSTPLLAHRMTFTVTIKNQGKSEAGRSVIYFYIDNSYQWQQMVEALDAGASVNKTFSWTAQPNAYSARAIADVQNYINESDETNNVKTATLTFSQSRSSDLIVQNIVCSPLNPSVGDTVTLAVTVKNQGSGLADLSHVAYYVDDTFQTSTSVCQIGAGATATKTFTWTALPGPHTFRAVADSNSGVSESNESNNEKTLAISVSAPDLIIQDITWSPASPSVGNSVTFTFTIKNQGSMKAGYSYVAYYVDGSSRGYHDVPDIEAGANVTMSFTWTGQADSHIFRVVADMENHVPETNESNNDKVITLPPPDLIIESINWLPANPSANTTVTFTATIRNQGSGKSEQFQVAYYIDETRQFSDYVKSIEAGTAATQTFTWTSQAGSHTVKAVADTENRVPEGSENNNEKAVAFSVLTPSPVTPIPVTAPAPAQEPVPATAPSPAPATASVPTPAPSAGVKKQEVIVLLDAQSNQVAPGQEIVFNLIAVNPVANPAVTVELALQVPAGISVTSDEFTKDDGGQYTASYSVGPGDTRQLEVYLAADREGSFDITANLTHYPTGDSSNPERKTLSLPVTVGTDEGPAKKLSSASSPEKGFWRRWWPVMAAVVLVGIAIVALLKSRQRSS